MRASPVLLVLVAACGGDDVTGGTVDAEPGIDATEVAPEGTITGEIRVDNFGWRTGDAKVAVLLGHAGATVELRRLSDGGVAATYTASAAQTDEDSGDSYATVDFTAYDGTGRHYLYLPAEDLRSYTFDLDDHVFDAVGEVAAKSFYFQRCNHDKVAPYAGAWTDASCHAGDAAATAGPGSAANGTLDLHGGWHDAGDYQKTLWGRGVPELLFAYEVNPAAWPDGGLDLPESGNGQSDLLDEIAWELDFYVRMQRPDGHFMTSVKDQGNTVSSPPSAADGGRRYFDGTSPSGDGWSGGGVTIDLATGNAVLALAHAAIVYESAAYEAAAKAGWSWLSGRNPTDAGERRVRAAAASAVFRMDPTITSAKTVADGFPWSTWDGLRGGSATPSEATIAAGAWHYLANASGTAAVKDAIEDAVADVFVGGAFDQAGAYGGMFGGPGNGWDWSWGSNRQQSYYGANLMMAVRYGILDGHTAAEVTARAAQHLHYALGLNPLNMVFLTNTAALGGEHSSFHVYHSWFSYTANDGDHGNADFDGKPADVDEPLYPYYDGDDQTSAYGPAPGLLVGGPNFYYSGQYALPDRTYPAYTYRDFSVGCDWDGAQCRAAAWELTEPMAAYQGPFVLLASFFMGD